MADSIFRISKQTLLNLRESNKNFTPTEYSKEYCKVAKKLNLVQEEC
jgi:hypothetical protein